MSDSATKAKLAAAKKRFKELKGLKENANGDRKIEKKIENNSANVENQQISDSVSESVLTTEKLPQYEEVPDTTSPYVVNSYFSEVQNLPSATSFFDMITPNNNCTFPTENLHNTNPFNQHQTADEIAFDAPEIKQNEANDNVNMITKEDAKKLEEYLHQDQENTDLQPEENVHENESDLKAELEEYKEKVDNLERCNAHIQENFKPMQEQLEYHRKTLEILVSEKTELIAALNEAQSVTRQKISENEDLQGRLRASRSRAADFEKEISSLRNLKEGVEKNGLDKHKEYDNLLMDHKNVREQLEEFQQTFSELQQKLNVQTNTNHQLQKELQDSKQQLDQSHLRVQQLTMGNETVQNQEDAKLKLLEKQNTELQEAVKSSINETEQASKQYQQYVEQLNVQMQTLATRVETLNADNIELTTREQNLVSHIGELEKQLQIAPQEKPAPQLRVEDDIKLAELQESLNVISAEKYRLEETYKEVEEERIVLEHKLHEAQITIADLENMAEKQKVDQPDMAKILATMESDKVAAARAVTQNNQLKQQLEELQEAFVRMSNNKLELTEKLEAEQHYNKEAHEKWKEKNSEIETLRYEMSQLKAHSDEISKHILVQNQLVDRLRHYEAHGQTSDILHTKLQDYKQTIESLTIDKQNLMQQLNNKIANTDVPLKQLEEFQQLVDKLTLKKGELQNKLDSMKHQSFRNNIPEDVQSELQTLRQLAEGKQLNFEEYVKLQECKQKYDSLLIENEQLKAQISAPQQLTANPSENHVENLDRENAMIQLEKRFTKMMIDVANLTDEKQRLEHIVLQLQGETETIGEYIALYQYQRAILKEKTLEKDEQLKRLARDRDEVKRKLDDLNSLIRELFVDGKHEITNDMLAKHEHLNNQVCSEHSHLQDQIIAANEQASAINGIDNNNEKTQTAGKIMALLSEIKSSNLVQPSDGLENFHPCPWCSGKLITV